MENRIYRYKENETFQKLLKKVTNVTLIDEVRLYVIYQLALNYADGNIAEVGVYRGGSAYILASVSEGKIDLFDTFQGMPETDSSIDYHKKGEFTAGIEEVKAFLAGFNNLNYYKGLFPQSTELLSDEEKAKKYHFVHIDVDIYQSAKDCLGYFYPRMEKGGTMLFDDYSFRSTPGVKFAIDKFLADKPETIIDINTGQGILIKI